METLQITPAGSPELAFQLINQDFITNPDILNYHKAYDIKNHIVELFIDIDLGGGFEGGYAITNIRSRIKREPDFRLEIHDESFLDEVGKFFGMKDVEVGYEKFDESTIIKTDDANEVHRLFEDQKSRTVFRELKDYKLSITHHHDANDVKQPFLEFEIEEGMNNMEALRPIFFAYCHVLNKLEGNF